MARPGGVPPRTGRVWASLLLVAVATVGCGAPVPGESAPSRSTTPSTSEPPEPVTLGMSVSDDESDVEPARPVTVRAENGRITGASLIGTHGTKVEHDLRSGGSLWTTTEPLGYGKTYTLTVRATGEDGAEVEETSTFTTATPARTVDVWINARNDETVGVGMPLIFTFSGAVPDRDAAEEALTISAEPETEGDFRWFGDDRVIWRPKEYWESGTEITVDARIYGRDLGEGTYGARDKAVTITVGEKLLISADGQSHRMTVTADDETIRTMPISMGKASSSTPNGTYTVMSEHHGYTLDSSTYGVAVDSSDGYRIHVDYAARLSNSGIFYHSAPWSVGDQGKRNVSHGCLNLAPEDAAWLMERSKRGDPVTVVNAGGQTLEPTDGWSVWQMSWEEWQSGAA
ncbi:L,D-transpeptidase [Saccharomonospora saliphila]|uniref:L,D-transpeptidase n=1 Tax=Saccharomonospora saliphila TaxID=369829 RepID=UPI0004916971|nr:Ig-like domain-containing protein [Saccharomonospora saliphila]